MPELRWTLLILGALFIGGLALWELRRQRHARGQDLAQSRDGERVAPTFDSSFEHNDAARDISRELAHERLHEPPRGDLRTFREPTLSFPDLPDRDPIADPPVVEVDDPSLAGLRVDEATAVDEFSSPEPEAPARSAPIVPQLSAAEDVEDIDATEADQAAKRTSPTPWPPVVKGTLLAESGHTANGDASEPFDVSPARDVASSTGSFALPEDALEDPEPIVDWPDEDARKIVAVRLVSAPTERFAGRAVRLALTAEGFRLGKFDIFHKPGPDARAVLSAASLTKPGTFSFSTMDAQRFGGLSLFAVLPGPLSPAATFDELLITARSLNNRLRGALQDERGEPLTPVRSASIRESLTAAATAGAPVVGPPA